MYKMLLTSLLLLVSAQAQAQSRGVVLPIPDAVSRGLGVLEVMTGKQLLAPLAPVTWLQFGAAGQFVLGGSSGLLVSGAHHRLGSFRDTTMAIDVHLMAGRFVVRHVMVGVVGGYAAELFDKDGQPKRGHVGPVAGFSATLHEHASILPLFALTYDTWGAPTDARVRHHTLNINLELGFLAHMTQHLSLSVVPFVTQSLFHHVANARVLEPADKATWDTAYGVKVGILGWL